MSRPAALPTVDCTDVPVSRNTSEPAPSISSKTRNHCRCDGACGTAKRGCSCLKTENGRCSVKCGCFGFCPSSIPLILRLPAIIDLHTALNDDDFIVMCRTRLEALELSASQSRTNKRKISTKPASKGASSKKQKTINASSPTNAVDDDDDREFVFKKIIARRGKGRREEVLVLWDDDSETWEPAKNFPDEDDSDEGEKAQAVVVVPLALQKKIMTGRAKL